MRGGEWAGRDGGRKVELGRGDKPRNVVESGGLGRATLVIIIAKSLSLLGDFVCACSV